MSKRILLIFLILISIFAISHVSAADNATGLQSSHQSADEIVGVADDETVLTTTHKIDSNNNTFDDIQNAIDSASEGDTVELTGTFSFTKTININKTINIVGTGDGANLKHALVAAKFRFFNIESSASNVVLDNLIFTGNSNSDLGAAVLWKGNGGIISNCVFTDNNVQGEGFGGALAIEANNCKVINSTFNNNNAYKKGGAIFISGKQNNISNCSFKDNYVYNSLDNTSIGYGGAIFSDCESLSVEGCTFNGNYVREGYGGAIAVVAKDNIISNSKFEGNYISNSPKNTSVASGGAIYSNGDALNINNCTFNENRAIESYGGAVSLGKSNEVKNSYFNRNYASLGNHIYSSSKAYVLANDFVLRYDESKSEAIYGNNLEIGGNNNFTVEKIESSVEFISTGLIFDYASSGSIYVKVTGGTISLKNVSVINHPEARISLINNVLTVSNLNVGNYILSVITTPDEDHYSTSKNLTVTVKKATAVIKASKLTVALKSGTVWTIKLVDSKSNNPIANMDVSLKVYTGKKYKTVNLKTNSKGEATYSTKGLSKGSHNVVVSASHPGYNFVSLKSSIKVIKPTPLKFKLQAKVNDKEGSLLSYTVLNKKTNKGVNGIKIKVLIYTGKKYKTFILKTKKIKGKQATYNGAVGFSTNKFSAGEHKVKFMPVSIKYKGSATNSIKLKKSATKGTKYFRTV